MEKAREHSIRRKLESLRMRYFRETMGHWGIKHHGDCYIWDDEYPHCSCGLMLDLDRKSMDSFTRVYPGYWDDFDKIRKKMYKVSDEEEAEAQKLLHDIFGIPEEGTKEREEYDREMEKENAEFNALVDGIIEEWIAEEKQD
jgi:hypothetical protein